MSKIEAAIARFRQMQESAGLDPFSDAHPSRRAGGVRPPPKGFAPVPPAMPDLPVIDLDPQICAMHRILITDGIGPSNAPAISSYRQLRTRLLQRARSHSWSTIGITSPGPGQGKSVNSINLALNLAREMNNNVFLIDMDLRNPSICSYLGVRPPHELARYFEGGADLRDVFFSVGIENLTLAGGTAGVNDSSELLASGRVEELFEHIRKVATKPLVIVDMPPVLSNDDALVVAPKVDGVLIVVSQGLSRRDAVAQTIELMGDFNIAGIVINRSQSLVTEYYGG